MFVKFWTTATLALFTAQYDWTVPKDPLDPSRVSVNNGSLSLCLFESDKSFKEKTDTLPRTELRLIEEFSDGIFNASVVMSNISLTNPASQYSVWQLFGSKPLLMLRVRNGVKQMVVFSGKPKIQVISDWPRWCVVKCGRYGSVQCGETSSFGRIRCKDKLHMKLGPYFQGEALGDICITYNEVSLLHK